MRRAFEIVARFHHFFAGLDEVFGQGDRVARQHFVGFEKLRLLLRQLPLRCHAGAALFCQ
ncbi:MAG TPA: hypothetical protein DEO85_14215 [Maritimibacter sp.]|nr:hypothetical protein [Maritimibacter sp.]